jgi:REP element-mobilizing transposase RayT
MSQSLSKLFVHIIFHIKNNSVVIKNEDENELYAYIGAIMKDNGSIPILINGTKDHIHILCVLSKNISLAKFVEEVKRHSSRWIKSKGEYYRLFAWQNGYSGFSVSSSLIEKTRMYIQNQEEHHKKMPFKEELIAFLKEFKVNYDERYLWSD